MFRYSVVFLFLSLKMTTSSGQANWKLMTEKDGIKVFSKEIETSKIKAVKVECTVKATASQLVTLLLDIHSAKDWVSHTKSCILLKKLSPSELYYYSEVSLPWPLENRDFVARIRVSQDPVTKVVTVDAPAVPGWVAVKKDMVRINHSSGYWVITPLDNQRVRVEYSLQVDPGGIIPAWLVNTLAAQGPLESFKSMRKQLVLPKYKNAALSFITN